MPIHYQGLSDRIRLARVGKGRLGEKAVSSKSGKEYPKKLDFIKLDPDDPAMLPLLTKRFGQKPKVLPIAIPSEDPEKVFPQYLKRYGKSGLICKGRGDGGPCVVCVNPETGEVDENAICDPDSCPYWEPKKGSEYEKKACKRLASFQFVLRGAPTLGVWQIDTTSQISITQINTKLEMLRRLCGRISGIPLQLSLHPIEVKPKGAKTKQVVYCMDVDLDPALDYTGLLTMSGEKALQVVPQMPPGFTQLPVGAVIPDPEEASAPDGLYARSQVEEGADPAAERRQIAEDAGEAKDVTDDEQTRDPVPPSGAGETAGGVAADAPSAGLPDDVVFGCRALGLTNRQVKALIARYGGEGGVLTVKAKDELVSYLSGLVDLKESGDEASLQANIAALDLPVEDPRTAPANAKSAAVKESAKALGLKGLDV